MPPKLLSVFACVFGLVPIAAAAISVSGISNETNYTGEESFTVGDPAGFVTSATLNGAAVAVGTSVSVSAAGFYELVVTQTPDGGGAPAEQSFLFNIREPGRGSTETGLPAFTAAGLVNDAPAAINTGLLKLVTPTAYPDDLPIPVVGLLQKNSGDPLWLNARVRIGGHPASTIQLRRGFGYAFLPAQTSTVNTSTAGLSANRTITIEDSATSYTPVSGSIASDVDFGNSARLAITADLTIDAGATMTIGAGSIVRIAAGSDIHVDGNLIINATPANPTTFAPATPGSAWGGFFLQETTSNANITGAIFHGSGADQTWFDTNSGFASHRDEQALFLVGPPGARLDLTDCYLIENTGQLLHNDEGGDITITRCLLQGATTCGELSGGSVTVDRSALLLFPDADPTFADGDNDAIYLTSGQHHFTNTVIGYTQDDGIDTGGSPSTSSMTVSSVLNCWFESILHEGMSNSGSKTCIAESSVFFNCGQTIESGYGRTEGGEPKGPQSSMINCLAVANMVGARFGDNYTGGNGPYEGNHLTVTGSLLLNNLYHDIWGYDWDSWTYNSDKMTVSDTRMTIAEDLARHPGNSSFDPVSDAALIAPYMPVPGSAVGVAITGTPAQSALGDYPGSFTVQLSTFSSQVVTVGYSLVSRSSIDAPDTTLLSGTLTFAPSQTRKQLDLPLPGGSHALVRVALDAPGNAAITGGEAWFLDADSVPTPLLIARGADWSYSADRAEPAPGWQGQPYDDSSWKSGPTPIGYGDGDEATLLTSAEYGPGGDRTTTVYFRKTFQVADVDAISALTLNLQRDDGAVVYLNGVEIARSNMAPGTVTYSTLANDAGGSSAENAYYDVPIPTALANLRSGSNVLAVEVHQTTLTSSDLSFDVELVATLASQDVELIRSANHAYIYWSDSAAILQESDDLIDWASTDARSPFLIFTDRARKFYRVLFP